MMVDTDMLVVKQLMDPSAKAGQRQSGAELSLNSSLYGLIKFAANECIIALYPAQAPNQYVISTRFSGRSNDIICQSAKPAFHPVANHSVSNFFCDGDAQAHRRV